MRIVIADDSILVRAGLASLVEELGHDVVAEVGDADSAIVAVATHRPDVVILDIRMPPTHTDEGVVAATAIRSQHHDVGVLVLSHYVEVGFAIELVRAFPGGVGYVLKDNVTDGRALDDALRRLLRGECVIDPTIVGRCMSTRAAVSALDVLSQRERDVLEQLAQGRSNTGIGEVLFVAERTVETHITQIFLKLGIDQQPQHHRRVLAALAYLRVAPHTTDPR